MEYRVQIASLPAYENLGLLDDNLTSCLIKLDQSLASNHASMSELYNPVLKRVWNGQTESAILAQVLQQYCFLPQEIVQLLSLGDKKVRTWKFLHAEIQRNIAEEQGSRTKGFAHYELLKLGLFSELGLDITKSQQSLATIDFLEQLKDSLINSTPSYALGNIYALENSAVPELYIVARLINSYCTLSDVKPPPISLPINDADNNQTQDFCLNSFFKMHLIDFEVGHKLGLAAALQKQYLETEVILNQFSAGFEYVLELMDSWWKELAELK